MKTFIAVILTVLVAPTTGLAKSCGHISQLAGALQCLKAHANETISEGNREHLVYVTGSEEGMKAIISLIDDANLARFQSDEKIALIEAASETEWFGLVIEMSDEPIFHYFFLSSGEKPYKVLDFNPMDSGDLVFPNLYKKRDATPFVLGLNNQMENWVLELFENKND